MSSQQIANRVIDVVSPAAMGAASKAMAELGMAGLIGAYCVQNDLVNAESIRALSKTSFSILLPCFLGTGIINTIVSQQRQQGGGGGIFTTDMLSPPLLAILHAFLLFQCSYHILLPLLGIDKDTTRGRSTAISCSFGNSGVIPLIFSEALFRNRPNILAQCYSGVSLYLVGWSPFFWSFGRSMLIGNENSFDSSKDDEALSSPLSKVISQTKQLASPPVKGVLTGMALASIPAVGKLLVDGDSPLSIVFNSFQNLGRAANPLGLLVLTSSLAMGFSTARSSKNSGGVAAAAACSPDKSATTQKNVSPLQRWSCVSLARFIISPPLMLGLLHLFQRIGFIASSDQNPVIWFILLLESCMPPAQNSVLMLQVAEKSEEASRMAQFLFGMYATSMLPVIIIVGIILQSFHLTN
mmetsp:Transcript_40673/g.85448  ORF Transcript_40673/g.85448 Transcript_40673/m.85448 type:complete len:411 (+) Transcript_40673:206-1438(+)